MILTKEKLADALEEWTPEKKNFAQILKASMHVLNMEAKEFANLLEISPSLTVRWMEEKVVPHDLTQKSAVQFLKRKLKE